MPGTGYEVRSVGGLPVVSAPGEIDKGLITGALASVINHALADPG